MFQKVLVPLDGSPGAEQALDCARSICNGTLVLLSVQDYPSVVDLTLDQSAAQAILESEDKAMQDYLERGALKIKEEGGEATWIHRIGDAASWILQEARDQDADLIVMASHGRSGLARFLLGSVTEKVMRHAHCPVMVVRQPQKPID